MKPTQIDLMLQKHSPIETVPVYGEFESLATMGKRFLLARDGLWLEARTPWVYVRWPISQSRKVQIPAGETEKKVRLAFKKAPKEALVRFIELAREVNPKEVGAIVVWDEVSGGFELMGTRTIDSGIGHLRYERPVVESTKHVAMDLHSHGPLKARFSRTDLLDTGSEVVIAAVVGSLDSMVEVRVELFVHGLRIPVTWPENEGEGVGFVGSGDKETLVR